MTSGDIRAIVWKNIVRKKSPVLFCFSLIVFWCCISSRASAQDIATGLIGHWKLDESSGALATDSSGNGHDGTYGNGPLLGTPGIQNTAVQFDGTNDKVTIPDDPSFSSHTTTGLTVSAWVQVLAVNTDLHSQTRQPIVAKGYSGNWEWALYIYSTQRAGFSSWQCGGSGHNELSGGPTIPLGVWTHVAATYQDGVANRVYVNGLEVASSTSFIGSPCDSNRPVLIGSREDGQYLNAMIDDVRIYNRVLSATDVAALHGLVGHWKFDDAAGTVAIDSTSSGNDANLFDNTTWISDCVGKGAIEFDGSGDYARTGQNFSPPSMGAVAFWMRGSGTLSSRQRLFGVNGNWEVRQETNGTLSFDLGASPYVGNEPFSTLTAVDEKDRWYHIVAMFDDTDDSFSVYIDGELITSGTSPVNLVPQAAGPLSFGTRTGSSEYWEGALRDFRVYNRRLANSEITNLSGVIAHWKLDETSGSVAVDASAAGNDATYIGSPLLGVNGAFVAKTGTAIDLDGSSESITAGKSLLNNLQEFTLAGWVRPDSVYPTQSFFGQYNLIELGIEYQANQINFWTSASGSISVTGTLPLGKWSHVAAVGDSLGLKLYVDGKEVASGGTSSTNFGSNADIFKIGEGVLNLTGGFFDGRVDDVRVFSRAMCPEEIQSIYGNGRPNGIRIIKWLEVR